jgi:hypothetical protein
MYVERGKQRVCKRGQTKEDKRKGRQRAGRERKRGQTEGRQREHRQDRQYCACFGNILQ